MTDSIERDFEAPGKMLGFQGIFQACSKIVDQMRKRTHKSALDWKTLEFFAGLQGLLFEEILERSRDPRSVAVMKEFITRNENDLPPRATRIAKNMHTALLRLERQLSEAPKGVPLEDLFGEKTIEDKRRMSEYMAQMSVSAFLFHITTKHKVSLADISKTTGISLADLAESSSTRPSGIAKRLDLKDMIFIGDIYDTRVHLDTRSAEETVRGFFKPIDLRKLVPRQERLTEAELEELPKANLGPIISLAYVRGERERSQKYADTVAELQSAAENLSGEWIGKIENNEYIRAGLQNIDSLIAAMDDVGRGTLDEEDLRRLIAVCAKYFDFTARNIIGIYQQDVRESLIPLTLRFSQMNLYTRHWQSVSDGTIVHTDVAETLGLIVATVNHLSEKINEILAGEIKTEYGHVRVALRKLQELMGALRGVLPEGQPQKERHEE